MRYGFEALQEPGNSFWLDFPGAKEHVRVLDLFGVTQFTPMLLAAKDAFKSPQDLVDVLRYCSVVSVRFNGVGHRNTHVLEEVYNFAALALRSGQAGGLGAVRAVLGPIYVPDAEFESDFTVLRLKSRGVAGKRLRYLLAKIERQLSGLDLSDDAMTATVEHILPQSPGELGWEHFSPEAHERAWEPLGNRSLLERNANSQQAGNGAFATKQQLYAQSQYRSSKDLALLQGWDEAAIGRRQAELARVAKTVWRLEA